MDMIYHISGYTGHIVPILPLRHVGKLLNGNRRSPVWYCLFCLVPFPGGPMGRRDQHIFCCCFHFRESEELNMPRGSLSNIKPSCGLCV